MTPPSAPLMRRKKKLQTATSSTSGMTHPRISGSQRLTTSPVYFTWCASRSSTSFGSSMRVVVNCVVALRPSPRGCFRRPVIVVSPTLTSATCPPRRSALNSLYGTGCPAGAMNQACTIASSSRVPRTHQTENVGRAPSGRRSPGLRSRGLMRGLELVAKMCL
jgi:hypothetical protein